MLSTRLVVSLLFVTLFASALPADEPVDLDMVNRIRYEGFHHSQVMSVVSHLADNIGTRPTGSPELREASRWTRHKLEEWGLENARLESYEPFYHGWSVSHVAVHMVQPRQVPLAALPWPWSPGTQGPVGGAAVRLAIESEDDFEKYRGKLRGKIVFLDEPRAPGEVELHQAWTDQELEELVKFKIPASESSLRERRERWQLGNARNLFLVEEGVLAAVEISPADNQIMIWDRFHKGNTRQNRGVPALAMTASHYNLVCRLLDLQADGDNQNGADHPAPVEFEVDIRARYLEVDESAAYNTLAEIPGRSDEEVLVGAHLDSCVVGSGATDNAAGCAVVMEAMRILKALDVQPRRTIRVALWYGEELNYLGSTAYVEKYLASIPVTGDPELPFHLRHLSGPPLVKPGHGKLSAYFNVDGGAGRIRGIRTQENAAVVPVFKAWLEPFHDIGATTVSSRNGYSTDHRPFDKVGIPAFSFIQDEQCLRVFHSPRDQLDYVKREDLVQAAVVVASFLYHAATRPELLPRKPFPVY
ncbi:MAG: M20/M25/M40 family metallo-hydrolase [bacterium]|nr:M20/M25/M40 family metallo-hydrolase [bacterium]